MNRKIIIRAGIDEALGELRKKTKERLQEKGEGVFVSSHEMLGIITEEYQELISAIQMKENRVRIYNELLDIAVACLVSMASIKTGGQDWL